MNPPGALSAQAVTAPHLWLAARQRALRGSFAAMQVVGYALRPAVRAFKWRAKTALSARVVAQAARPAVAARTPTVACSPTTALAAIAVCLHRGRQSRVVRDLACAALHRRVSRSRRPVRRVAAQWSPPKRPGTERTRDVARGPLMASTKSMVCAPIRKADVCHRRKAAVSPGQGACHPWFFRCQRADPGTTRLTPVAARRGCVRSAAAPRPRRARAWSSRTAAPTRPEPR